LSYPEVCFQKRQTLDLARWNYLFEGSGKEDVLRLLASYQNPDGGCGQNKDFSNLILRGSMKIKFIYVWNPA